MPLFVVIGLGLEDIPKDQRQRLKAGLPYDWSQAGGQSVWGTRFDDHDPAGVGSRALRVVVDAARVAGVARLPAVVAVTSTPPVLATDALVLGTMEQPSG
jgi:hypothetical protein